MIRTEYFMTRKDGVKLYRSYSDEGKIIIRNDGEEFEDAVDVENSGYTYTESEDYINSDETEE